MRAPIGNGCDWSIGCASQIGLRRWFVIGSDHFHPESAIVLCSTHRRSAVRRGLHLSEVAIVDPAILLDRELAARDERIDAGLGTGYIGEFR